MIFMFFKGIVMRKEVFSITLIIDDQKNCKKLKNHSHYKLFLPKHINNGSYS